MQTYTCVNCGKVFNDYASNRKKSKNGETCCSMKCKGEHQTKLAIERAPKKIVSVCSKCKQEKPVSEFYQDKKNRANGSISYLCKACVKNERIKQYDENTDQINARVREYQRLHPGRHGKRTVTNDESRAQSLLNDAVKSRKVIRPEACQKCGKHAKRIHGHHWHGYGKPYDVIWLCPSCHHAEHGRGPKARQLSVVW